MNSLDDELLIKNLDKSGMFGAIGKIPGMVRSAAQMAELRPPLIVKGCEFIFLAGMGGSALAGDLLCNLLRDQLAVPMMVVRNYEMPRHLNNASLIFVSSYSGETEETLSCLKEAEKAKAKIVCAASGGKLKKIAEANKYQLIDIPGGYQPRAALAYFLISIGYALEKSGLIKEFSSKIPETLSVLGHLSNIYGINNPERQNPVKQMAQKLAGKIPVIFVSAGTTEAIGKRLKNQLNENSKMNAMVSVFPELNHNEIAGFAQLNRGEHNLAAVFIKDAEDHLRINKRIEITRSLLGAKMGGTMEIPREGNNRLARMMSQILFIDYLSAYLAILGGLDPTAIDAIEKFKREMVR